MAFEHLWIKYDYFDDKYFYGQRSQNLHQGTRLLIKFKKNF